MSRLGKVMARMIVQEIRQFAPPQKRDRLLDRLTGHVFARHPFAEALGPVVERDAHDEIVGLGALMRRVLNRLL